MQPNAMPRPRRSERTRDAILRAARIRFADTGYNGTTIRAVAADAGIDPSMVMRYFGSKDGLFAAATHFDLALPELDAVPREQLGAAAVDHFLHRWELPEGTDGLRLLLATAVTDLSAAATMHTIFATQLAPVVRAAAGVEHPDEVGAEIRAALIATQMLGLALCRYILRLPSVVELDPATLVSTMGPVVQHYLTGDLVAP